MRSYVYRCCQRADTYLYLAERDAFDALPEPVRAQLGRLEFVLEVDLEPPQRLAREDPALVRANLAAHGFHLQLPPPPLTVLPASMTALPHARD